MRLSMMSVGKYLPIRRAYPSRHATVLPSIYLSPTRSALSFSFSRTLYPSAQSREYFQDML
jgi:hypothetical protein